MDIKYFLRIFASLLAIMLVFLPAEAGNSPGPALKAVLSDAGSRPVSPSMAGTSIVLTYADQWAGPAEEAEVGKTPPPLLRFPAGTHAMFFDWETGRYSGEGMNASRAQSGYTVEQFFELARRYGSEVSYIVNVYQDTPEKSGRLARLLFSKGYRVKYWELGNEPYAHFYADKLPDAEAYIREARAHAREIQKVFPNAAFGLAADPRTRHINGWNSALAAQQDFPNIIVHKYFGPDKAKREEMLSRSIQPEPDKAYQNMLKDSDMSEPNFVCRFPGKKFWVTEWGLLFIGFDLQDSLAHAIWMGRTFIKMSRASSIEAAEYWNLNAPPFELIQPLPSGGFIRRVPFYVYRMILDQLSTAERTSPVVFSPGSDEVVAQLFTGKGGSASMLIVNSSPAERTVEIPQALSGLTIEVISGTGLLDSNGYSKAFTPSLRDRSSESLAPARTVTSVKNFKLPGYSVAAVYFRM